MIAAVVNAVEVTIVVNSLKRVVNQIAVVNPNINVASGILCWKNAGPCYKIILVSYGKLVPQIKTMMTNKSALKQSKTSYLNLKPTCFKILMEKYCTKRMQICNRKTRTNQISNQKKLTLMILLEKPLTEQMKTRKCKNITSTIVLRTSPAFPFYHSIKIWANPIQPRSNKTIQLYNPSQLWTKNLFQLLLITKTKMRTTTHIRLLLNNFTLTSHNKLTNQQQS